MSRRRAISLPESFYDDGLITGVVKVIRSGKEATVYCCRAGPSTAAEYLAAFNILYRDGRVTLLVALPAGRVVAAVK